jgi:PelA/Pel-15E family pectate lyase
MLVMTGAILLASAVLAKPDYELAQGLTESRIRALPEAAQRPWLAYLEKSRALMATDKTTLAAERGNDPIPPLAPKGPSGSGGMSLDRDAGWYGSPEAKQVAQNILSFQTPAGGWGKNQERRGPARVRGQSYAAEDFPFAARDIAGDPDWAFVGTIDNGATTLELKFLARVQRQFPGAGGDAYRQSFLHGIRYLLAAQYPNGGWPQVFPLMGGYHDAITFNDDAMANVIELLSTVGKREGDYDFVPRALAREAGAAAQRGYTAVLDCQVMVNGRRTIWGQQHDPLTLLPVAARSNEPPALSGDESAGVLALLMRVAEPSPRVVRSVHDAAAWLEAHAIHDVEWSAEAGAYQLRNKPGAGPLWARFYSITTGKPVFGDRERKIHDDVNQLPAEQRTGYKFYSARPGKILEGYRRWAEHDR